MVALELLHGGMDEDLRERIKGDFQKPPHMHPVRIIVATDTASEGIDLQDHCHRLVNYDIPFNPNRLEQRAGRIDRYGQTHRPQILHFVGAQWKNAPPESAEADLRLSYPGSNQGRDHARRPRKRQPCPGRRGRTTHARTSRQGLSCGVGATQVGRP